MFIPAIIEDRELHLLVDTGATISLISKTVVDEMPPMHISSTVVQLTQANGAAIRVHGEIEVDVEIGSTVHRIEMTVAEIEQDGILGLDFLQKTDAKINCEQQSVIINKEVIPCPAVNENSPYDVQHIETVKDVPRNVPSHLETLYSETTAQVQDHHHPEIAQLLQEYEDVFSKGDNDIGRTTMMYHSIHTTCPAPIRQQPRRPPMGMKDEIDKQIHEMLEKGIITPSSSPWSSPVVLVDKKDGTKRFCVDYRLLNKNTVKDSYPLPRIDESIDALDGAKYFCTLDLASGYWQVPLDDEAKPKSAFVVPGGLYQFEVMPFGLCNAPSTFERLMETVLSGLHWKILLIYLDDVIIFGSSVNEVVERLKIVLDRLREANLKLKPKKCHLFQKEVLYLGHVVSEAGVSTDPSKIESIKTWPTPANPTDVRSFLGLASYYRRYIKGFAHIAKPLHALTQKEVQFVWSQDCEEAFQMLKDKLTASPILAYPRVGTPFIMDTDASQYAIGAVLSQEQDERERVVAYGSRTLTPPEQNYCVTRKELLAIIHFLKHFKHYLYGQEVRVRTDHGALTWLLNFKHPEGQLARWLEVITQYQLTLIHRPGRIHRNADGLSRRPCSQCGRLKDVCKEKMEFEELED